MKVADYIIAKLQEYQKEQPDLPVTASLCHFCFSKYSSPFPAKGFRH